MELEINRAGTAVLWAKPDGILLVLLPQLRPASLHCHPSLACSVQCCSFSPHLQADLFSGMSTKHIVLRDVTHAEK